MQSTISPILSEIPYLHPLSVLKNLNHQPYSFLLESSLQHNELGRFSFIGSTPFLTIKSMNGHVEVAGDESYAADGNPFDIAGEYLRRFAFRFECDHTPFVGGAVGYFGYGLRQVIEKLPNRNLDDLSLPDMMLGFYDSIIIFDHQKKRCMISMIPELRSGSTAPNYEKWIKDIQYEPEDQTRTKPSSSKLQAPFSKDSYIDAIRKVKQYISAGDIFQANLSQRFETELKIEPLQLYEKLRTCNPSPFSAYLDFHQFQIISSSPERFLKISDGTVETRPIKGTRPRGDDPDENARQANDLVRNEKDKAENLMIVDLLRNDLGKVCEYGSVNVQALFELETYPTLFHLVSTVTGRMRRDMQPLDVLKACFPGGSITGAPKIRAMEIIDELEPVSRGVYTGSIGYVGFNGNMDTNIAIRTIIAKDGKAYFHVGSGIVADSSAEAEYAETLHKARALMQALETEL